METVCGWQKIRHTVIVAAALAGALSAFAPCVDAEVSESVFTARASNEQCQGSYSATFEDGEWDPNNQTFTWTLPVPVDIRDECSGEWIATLLDAHLSVRTAQLYEIVLNAAVVSGSDETRFMIGSPLVSFPVVPEDSAVGRAWAAVTLDDIDGDGACLMGLGTPGTGVFRSYYNGYLSDGTRFTHLVGLISITNGGTASASQFDPLSGFRSIGAEVADISTEIAFILTPNDYASAFTTTRVPEPGGCVGDINRDGVINSLDLVEFLAVYGTTSGDPDYDEAADFDGDGYVGVGDLSQLLAVYGQSCW